MGGSRAASSVDTMLHNMRRRCNISRVRAHRWRHCSAKVLTGGQLNGVNFFACVTTRAQSRGELVGKWPRQAGPIYSSNIDGDAVTGGRPDSHAKMG
jgi:hypothetical protein